MATKKEESTFRARRLSLNSNAMDGLSISNEGSSPAGGRKKRLSLSPEKGQKLLAPPFPPDVIGTFSCHGAEPKPGGRGGSAKINQDRGCVIYPLSEKEGVEAALFGVCDGHGVNGDKVSQFVVHEMELAMSSKGHALTDPARALAEAFVEVDDKLKKERSIDAELSGTTAVFCLYKVESGKHKIWCANAGDSRAVLYSKGGKCTDLSVDQKPDTPKEMARIKAKGGHVSPPEEEWGGPARVWLDAAMTIPGLAMARSIGDHLVADVGVIAEPEVLEFEIDPCKDLFLTMASDGVWEFIESANACKILQAALDKTGGDATIACTALIDEATKKWKEEEGDYRDDITAFCIKIPQLFPS